MTLAIRENTSIKPSAYDLFNPERYAVLEKMATTLLASGMLPQTLKQPAQVIAIMLKSYELGVPPMEGLSGIAVIQGKPTVSPQLMLALIERSGAGSISILEREAHQSVIEAHRRGRKPVVFVFTFEDAKKLGLAGKDNYLKQPAVMLQWRNVAAAARAVFPDVISGLYTPDEMGAEIQILDDGTQEIIIDSEPQEALSKPTRVSKLGNEAVTTHEAAQTTLDIPGVTRGTVDVSNQITTAQTKQLWTILSGLEFSSTEESKAEARAFLTWLLLEQGHEVKPILTVKDLTAKQASLLIALLGDEPEAGEWMGKWFDTHEQAQHDAADDLSTAPAVVASEDFKR